MRQPIKFDFELMARLAIEAPEEFARMREALIREAIESFQTPSNGALLQAEIDAQQMPSPQEADALAVAGKRVAALAAMLSLEIWKTEIKYGVA